MADKTWGQSRRLLELVDEQGLDYDGLRARIDSGILTDVLNAEVDLKKFSDPAVRLAIRTSLGLENELVIAEKIVSVPSPQIYPVTFVPGLTWRQRIERVGGWIDPEIWQYIDQFPPIDDEDPSPLDVVLHHFGKKISSVNAEVGLITADLDQISPARFMHLLEQHPDLQRKFPLVNLKVVCTDRNRDDRVLSAYEDDDERYLYLYYQGRGWRDDCRFPAARKQTLVT